MNFLSKLLVVMACCVCIQACKTSKDISETTIPKPVGVDPALINSSLSYADVTTTVEEPTIDPLLELEATDAASRILIASMQRTSCYGKCPEFEAKVFGNGLVLYDGKAHVAREGLYEAYVLQAQIDSLMSQAEQLSYFDMAQKYPKSGYIMGELPSTITYVKQGAKEHKITNNHNAPKSLQKYEAYFETLLDELDWRPVIEH